jgi:hypothetical protein
MGGIGDLLMQGVSGGGGHKKPAAKPPKSSGDSFTDFYAGNLPKKSGGTGHVTHPYSAPKPSYSPSATGSSPRPSSSPHGYTTLQSYTGSYEKAPTKDQVHEKRSEWISWLDRFSHMSAGSSGAVNPDSTLIERPAASSVKDRHTEQDYGHATTHRLSREDFARLSPEEQSAVRFNTLLVQAREKDLNHRGDYTPDNVQKAEYEKTVRQMFGKHGGSETFAPETVAVLKRIDFEQVGDDLDDYLGLKTAVTQDDLRSMHDRAPAKLLLTSAFEAQRHDNGDIARAQHGEQMAEHTAKLREAMARANHLMTSFKDSAALDRNDDVLKLGGEINHMHPEFGYGQRSDRRPDYKGIDVFLPKMFHTQALRSGVGTPESWASLYQADAALPDLDVRDAYLRYADTRTQIAKEFELPLYKAKGFRTAQEFRKALGLGKKKGDI